MSSRAQHRLGPQRVPHRGLARTLAATALLLGASAGLATAPASLAREIPAAHTAKAVSLNESGRLTCTSKHGFTLNEQGPAAGSIGGTLYVHLTIVSSSRVTAEVNFYPRGGSLSGYATASYDRGTTTASFTGSLSVKRGSGSYAHAQGSGLSFTGTIQHSNDAVTVHVSGSFSD